MNTNLQAVLLIAGCIGVGMVIHWLLERAYRPAEPAPPYRELRVQYLQVIRMVEDDEEEPEPWVKASDRFRLVPGSTDQEIIDNLLREV